MPSDEKQIRVILAEASDGEQAIALVARDKPEVAVFDIQMPKMYGLEATRRVRKEFSQTRVLILTAHD